jgi:hypothetical protein
MSKKKNTLKDLDEFLKQQAATLVAPPKLSVMQEPERRTVQADAGDALTNVEITIERIMNDLQALAGKQDPKFKKDFYDLIIRTLESQTKTSPEDKILINTALYLKHGNRWKEMVRAYWKDK